MAFADKFENGTVAKLRNGRLATYTWIRGKLFQNTDGYWYKVDDTTFFHTKDGRKYSFRKELCDVMAIYKPEFDEFGSPISPEKLVQITNPIWVREPAPLTDAEWRKLREDKEVIVSGDNIHWLKRNFCYYAQGKIYTYPNGRNKWTGEGKELEEWKYGRLPQ